jgi:hypothetical protein
VPLLPNSSAPREVRLAGVLVGAQGLAGLAFTIALLVRGLGTSGGPGGNTYGEAGFFVIMSVGISAVAVGLLLGKRPARTPAAVLQVILLAVAFWVIGPSGQVPAGIGVGALCVLVLVLLFTAKARAWAVEGSPRG